MAIILSHLRQLPSYDQNSCSTQPVGREKIIKPRTSVSVNFGAFHASSRLTATGRITRVVHVWRPAAPLRPYFTLRRTQRIWRGVGFPRSWVDVPKLWPLGLRSADCWLWCPLVWARHGVCVRAARSAGSDASDDYSSRPYRGNYALLRYPIGMPELQQRPFSRSGFSSARTALPTGTTGTT